MNWPAGFLDNLNLWAGAQEAFWQAAVNQPAFSDVSGFAPPQWQSPEALFQQATATLDPGTSNATGRSWAGLLHTQARIQEMISATWHGIREEFEVHRLALTSPPGETVDWRAARDRWFAIAEPAFLALLRQPEYCAAQRDHLTALCAWMNDLSPEMRETVSLGKRTQRTAMDAVLQLAPVAIAQSPKTVIWRRGDVTVSRYKPLAGRAPSTGPLLICYGLVGRQTMTDLLPERSLVRNLLSAGCDVYVVDWGDDAARKPETDLSDYVLDWLPQCMDAVRTSANVSAVTLMGICQGGTLAACHAAMQPEGINGLICAGTPIDFHADDQDHNPAHGFLNLWARALSEAEVEALTDLGHCLPGDFMGAIFNQLNPVRTLARYAIDLPEAAQDPGKLRTFMAMETWLADRPDLPQAFARTWLVDLYQRNALVDGKLMVAATPVDLGQIQVPVLNIIAEADHIIPPPCSRALSRFVLGERYRELTIPAGHIGTFVGSKAQTLTAPGIMKWLRERQ